MSELRCYEHPFSFENALIAESAFQVYTIEGPVYRVVNKVMQDDRMEEFPDLFPLINTISCGLVNLDEAVS